MDKHGTTFDRFVECAIEIIDERGLDGLVMREIASRTHYSVSTVSYHVTPWAAFLTTVWDSVRLDLIARVVSRPPIDEQWCRTLSRRVLSWSAEHPQLAHFLVSHFPQPDLDIGRSPAIQQIWRDLGLPDGPVERAATQLVIRQAQSLVEVAIHVGGEAGVTLLADQLMHQFAHWYKVYAQVVEAGQARSSLSHVG